jgi:hypothetical protein
MKKSTVKVMGGLGNQLHCYAFGKAVASHNKSRLLVDSQSGYWNDQYNREFLLNNFPGYHGKNMNSKESKFSKIKFKLKNRLLANISYFLPLKFKFLIKEDTNPYHFQENLISTSFFCNPYFEGYWASYKYYKLIKEDLCLEFVPPIPTNKEVLKVAKAIKDSESCAIHIRSYKEESGIERKDLKKYYQESISKIRTKSEKINFFVFSDDNNFARNLLENIIDSHFIFVDLQASQGNIQSFNDFYLIYICNNAIIGDSTFSWWASWLSDSKKKYVIAPRGLSPWGADWIPANWIAVDAP